MELNQNSKIMPVPALLFCYEHLVNTTLSVKLNEKCVALASKREQQVLIDFRTSLKPCKYVNNILERDMN